MIKSEMFGTRPSKIIHYLKKIDEVSILQKFWFVTCIRAINCDKKTRYLLIKECESKDELITIDLSRIRPYFREYIDLWVVFIDDEHVYLKKENRIMEESNSIEFKEKLLTKTLCEYLPGYGLTSKVASPFSQFFRTNMGKCFSLTDIDFMIQVKKNKRLIILEEKTFVSNGFGLLGYGQYLSFKEIYYDALNKKSNNSIKWYIAFIDNEDIYLYDATLNNFPSRPIKYEPRWGKMIEIPLTETKKIIIKDFNSEIKGIAYD